MSSIKQRRLRQVINTIIKEELTQGKFPSSQRVLWRISQYLQENDLEKPSNKLRTARPSHPIDPLLYNTSIDEIINDLSIVYECLVDYQNTTGDVFNAFEVEKKKLEYMVDNLEKELSEIISSNLGQSFKKSIYDIFTDTQKIDHLKTDADIDLVKKEVLISKANKTTSRVKVGGDTDASFSIANLEGVSTKVATGNICNIFSNTQGLVWQQEVHSDMQKEIIGTLDITFKDPISFNQININLHSVKRSTLMIEVSRDGETWDLLPRYDTPTDAINSADFIFPMIKVKAMRILISKQEADKLVTEKDKSYYLYLYGIKDVSFYKSSYNESSVLQSKPFDLKDSSVFTIDKVYLDTDVDMPNGTNTNYYIALSKENPEWIPISASSDPHPKHPKLINFHNIEDAQPEVFNFPSNISVENVRQLPHLNVNGVRFFKLGAILDRKIIPGSEKLFCGKNSWKVDTLSKDLGSNHIPVAADWVGESYGSSYLKMNERSNVIASNKPINDNTLIRYSCSVYVNSNQSVTSHRLMCNAPCSVYVNGDLVYSGRPDNATTVDYYLKRGYNDIIIMTYVVNQSLTLDIGIDLLKRGQRVYASSSPYRLVSLFDLQYNIRNNRKDVYAITYINDQAVIVLNDYILDIDYEFYYRYTTEANTKTDILFKCELERDPAVTDLSPKLKSYTLRFLL